jgi:hypothetical protein
MEPLKRADGLKGFAKRDLITLSPAEDKQHRAGE